MQGAGAMQLTWGFVTLWVCHTGTLSSCRDSTSHGKLVSQQNTPGRGR